MKSTTNSIEDMMSAVVDARDWLKNECNAKCEMNENIDRYVRLESRDDPRCFLDQALMKIGFEYDALKSKANELDPRFDWDEIAMSRRDQQQEAVLETLEEGSYIVTDLIGEFLALIKYWSQIDLKSQQRSTWLAKSMAMTMRIEQVKGQGGKRCSKLEGDLRLICDKKDERNKQG